MLLCRLFSIASITALVGVGLGTTSTVARAQPRDLRGGASLSLDTRYSQVTEGGAGDGREHSGSVGLSLRVLVNKSWLRYAAGLDYRLGGTYPGGFLYEANLYPLGTGFLIGPNARISLMAGVGFSGVVEQVRFSAQFPVELLLEFDLHRRLRVAMFGRAIWLTDIRRGDGSESFSWVDEVIGGVSLRWGKRYFPHDNRMSAGNGYFLGVQYQEQLGTTVMAVLFGYSLNVSIGAGG